MGHVTCVGFTVCGHRLALEARHVRRIDTAATLARHAAIETLLFESPGHPTRWLTLHTSDGPWQLGIGGESEIVHLPSAAIHPLPPLLAARVRHPALCGVAMQAATITLLVDVARLAPPAAADSTG